MAWFPSEGETRGFADVAAISAWLNLDRNRIIELTAHTGPLGVHNDIRAVSLIPAAAWKAAMEAAEERRRAKQRACEDRRPAALHTNARSGA